MTKTGENCLHDMDEDDKHTQTYIRYVYSDKIKDRRKSLFPRENFSERVDKFSDSSDLDCMSPLSFSDNEYANSIGVDTIDNCNIGFTSSTKLISTILSTPKSKKYSVSEQSMSPLYLSPYKNTFENTKVDKCISSSDSPTKHLKTPNDSYVHSGILPKLSRKTLQECVTNTDQQESSLYPVHSKSSKVRTSLFPEFDVSLAPKQFYPKMDSNRLNVEKLSKFKPTDFKVVRKVNKKRNNRKRIPGQINAGVHHYVKRPKKRKSLATSNLPTSALAKIKTFKRETVVNSEFKGFLKDLEELTRNKGVKLIQHISARNTSNSTENQTISNLKRLHDDVDDVSCKKPKLSANSANSTSIDMDPLGSVDIVNEELEVEYTQNINVDQLLNLLNDSIGEEKENETTKNNGSSVVEQNVTESLLSPTSQMCNMASVMKIDSPKKVKNLNLVFQTMNRKNKTNQAQENDEKPEQPEYFPIFRPNYKATTKSENVVSKESCSKRKRPKISSNQMLLDAGQKHFGLVICGECNYAYHVGDHNDETMHEAHHNATHILQFNGWKNERILEKFPNGGRITQVLPGDSKFWIDKVERVIEVINRDMGYYDMTSNISFSKVFLFIESKTITGCLVAEHRTKGFKVLSSNTEIDLCSTEEYPIECGVSRIWVSSRFRKKGIATKLMNILKSHFVPGRLLRNSDIALSSPTIDGKLFAAKYFETPNFLTYFD